MNAYIFHGSTPQATADKFWYQWLAQELNEQGIQTEVVVLPSLSRQSLKETLSEVEAMNLDINHETILIGHSAGANLILTLLETLKQPVAKVLLVAGFSLPTTVDEPTLKKTYDWQHIKQNAGDVYILNAFNDPFGCDFNQGHDLFQHLGGRLILDNGGHYLEAEYPFFLKLLTV